MTVSRDTYVSRFLALAGWDTVAHADEERYPAIEIDAALLAATHPGAHCLLIDGELTSWYGSRAIAGLGYQKNLTTEIALAPSDVR